MPLSFDFAKDRKEKPMVTFGTRLFLTADQRVVEEGDPDALQLLAGENAEIPLAIARQYGLVDEHGKPGKNAPKGIEGRVTGNRTMVASDGTEIDPVSGDQILIEGKVHSAPQANAANDALDERHEVTMADAAQETKPGPYSTAPAEGKAVSGPDENKAMPAKVAATKADAPARGHVGSEVGHTRGDAKKP